MEITSNDKYMAEILVDGEMFRVANIAALEGVMGNYITVRHKSLKEGLNVEQKLPNGDFIVILTVTYDEEEGEPVIDYVKHRDIDMLNTLINEVKNPTDIVLYLEEYLNCVELAENILKDLYEEEK